MKSIIILIGKKGSGKTHIGQLIHKHFGIFFLRVEDICLAIKGNRGIDDKSYISDVFKKVESEARNLLMTTDRLVFESTGAAFEFDSMVDNLRKDFQVVLIKIEADSNICLYRVKNRDQSGHIPVSDENVSEINKIVDMKRANYDLVIINNSLSEDIILEILKTKINEIL